MWYSRLAIRASSRLEGYVEQSGKSGYVVGEFALPKARAGFIGRAALSDQASDGTCGVGHS